MTIRSVVARPSAPVAEPTRPKLRVIDQRRMQRAVRRRRLVFAVASTLIAAMFVSALAQAELVRGQQELNGRRSAVASVTADRERLEREIVVASAPHVIVERARAMGMVRATEPRYLAAVRAPEKP